MKNVAKFCEAWSATLWMAMHKTQRGLRLNAMGNSGRGDDRRADKIPGREGRKVLPPVLRRYKARYGGK